MRQAVATIADEDSHLIARFVDGDSTAFDQLFQRYQDYVYRIIYGVVGSSEEARDLTQDVFLQVYKGLPRFRHGARFATWLYRVALNRAVDAERSSRRWRWLPLYAEPHTSSAEPEFAESAEKQAVRDALKRCPLQHRQILSLRYFRELSIEEIAQVMGCSVAAAKVRLHRARAVFKKVYTEADGAAPNHAAVEDRDGASPARQSE